MSSNPYIVSVQFTDPDTWKRLSSTSLVLAATATPWPQNSTFVEARIDGGAAESLPPGVAWPLDGVDLSRIEVRGVVGDGITVAGHSR